MRLFLQIELRPWQNATYQKPMLTFASSLSSDLIGAEMDNQSDASIADILIKLCKQATHLFILIHAEPDEPFGASLTLVNRLLRMKQKIDTVIVSGNNFQVERITVGFGQRVVKENDQEKIKDRVRAFALT